MATITLKFDPRNAIARKTIDFVLSLGVFKVKEEDDDHKSMKKAMKDIQEGRISKADNVDDLFENLGLMYSIFYTNQFEKSLKRCQKRGLDMSVIKTAIKSLELHGELPPKYKAHKLTGNYSGFWECHLKADWLLVWMQNEEGHTLLFTDTGSHSDLF